ncbi:MAG: helix-turn-helix domain-containing protein [Dokdonella sp.]|jgi:CRP/FNR family transcriptional regulator|nr:helix-turn-helix domain-containing protein [Dokdonella sp.]
MTTATAFASAPTATRSIGRTPAVAFERHDEIGLAELQAHVPAVRRKIAQGQYLYRAGQPFAALFLVNTGCFKTCELAEDGREQVTGFRMRGDLVGVESIGLSQFACDVVALEDGEVWELPYPPMLTACLRIPVLQARLTSALAEEVRRDRLWMLALGTLGAERRVAAFLLDLAERHARLGFSGRHFILRMSRADMASYLALKHETVSRALSRLDALGHIAVQRREIRILDADGLRHGAEAVH